MSVLVKGMEKPEHCGYCRFRYDGICHALQKTQYSMNECPLVVIDDAGLNDTISRQAAIDEIRKCRFVVDAIEKIRGLPSAQQWIPCSERTPEDLSEVNVTWINHNPEPYYEFAKDKPFTATAVYYKDKWYWYSATCTDYLAEYGKCDWDEVDGAIEIVAWMPLPKPYKEKEE